MVSTQIRKHEIFHIDIKFYPSYASFFDLAFLIARVFASKLRFVNYYIYIYI
jgi:hypothetical protein